MIWIGLTSHPVVDCCSEIVKNINPTLSTLSVTLLAAKFLDFSLWISFHPNSHPMTMEPMWNMFRVKSPGESVWFNSLPRFLAKGSSSSVIAIRYESG